MHSMEAVHCRAKCKAAGLNQKVPVPPPHTHSPPTALRVWDHVSHLHISKAEWDSGCWIPLFTTLGEEAGFTCVYQCCVCIFVNKTIVPLVGIPFLNKVKFSPMCLVYGNQAPPEGRRFLHHFSACAVLCLATQLCWLFATPWTIVCQAPLSMGVLQARILEWVVMPFSRGSSQPRNETKVSHIAGRFFTVWASREAGGSIYPTAFPPSLCHSFAQSLAIS